MKKIIDKFIIKEYKFKYLIFSIISGILIAIPFKSFNFYLLAWSAFIPLIYCIYKNNLKYSVLYGFVTGITFALISFDWMFLFLLENTKFLITSLIMALILWLYISMYFTFWSVIVNFIKKLRALYVIVFAACLWASFEYIRNYFFTGFPINLLGYSQAFFLPIIQFSDIFGVYGISFLIVLINMLFFYWFYKKEKKYLLCAIIILLCLTLFGFFKINKYSNINNQNSLKIGVVQPNIVQYKKNKQNFVEEIKGILLEASKCFSNKNIDILAYPETVLPARLQVDEDMQKVIKQIASVAKITLIGGKYHRFIRLYNAIFLISQEGNIINKYKKKHLILFGETVPFENMFVRTLRILNLSDSFSKEEVLKVFEFDNYTLGINICSENYYPYLSRELVLKGATLLTTHSNDSWCDGLSYPNQHFVLNVFRAIENRKYLIVAANTGISGVIAPSGKIIKQTKNQEQVCFEENVYTNNYITIYDIIGDIFVCFCMAYVILILLFYGIFVKKYIKVRA